ncbi:hypothetical protein O3P69_018989 [Scylla paramamosain]|uniref:Kazal-like domain-containing protein n=1 Tax=Scylla paramamosain TaxID=85552 RepID=A0AAW0SBU2_SCYPA
MEGPYSPSEATLVGSSEGQVSRQGSEAGSREGTCIKSRSSPDRAPGGCGVRARAQGEVGGSGAGGGRPCCPYDGCHRPHCHAHAAGYCNVNRLMALATDPDNAALATQDPARWWGAVRGLAGNRVLGLSVGVDLLVGCGVGALSSWGPALYPHPPQADQYYTGISSTTAIIVGVGVGGVWVVRCRPRARTLALLLAVLVGVMAAAHAPLAALTCGGEEGLPGVLSMDGSTLALHRACSEGCYCDAGGAYQPVCVRDGPLMLPYFSPCHAGCPPPPLGQPLGNCT